MPCRPCWEAIWLDCCTLTGDLLRLEILALRNASMSMDENYTHEARRPSIYGGDQCSIELLVGLLSLS